MEDLGFPQESGKWFVRSNAAEYVEAREKCAGMFQTLGYPAAAMQVQERNPKYTAQGLFRRMLNEWDLTEAERDCAIAGLALAEYMEV